MTTKHTPGPWSVNRKCKRFVDFGPDGDGLLNICECDMMGEMPRSEAESNATLIAAAPEMLQLLSDIGAWLEVALRQGQINTSTANRDGDFVSQIRATISKAKGE